MQIATEGSSRPEADLHKCRRVLIPQANYTFASREWRDEVAQVAAHWIVRW